MRPRMPRPSSESPVSWSVGIQERPNRDHERFRSLKGYKKCSVRTLTIPRMFRVGTYELRSSGVTGSPSRRRVADRTDQLRRDGGQFFTAKCVSNDIPATAG